MRERLWPLPELARHPTAACLQALRFMALVLSPAHNFDAPAPLLFGSPPNPHRRFALRAPSAGSAANGADQPALELQLLEPSQGAAAVPTACRVRLGARLEPQLAAGGAQALLCEADVQLGGHPGAFAWRE